MLYTSSQGVQTETVGYNFTLSVQNLLSHRRISRIYHYHCYYPNKFLKLYLYRAELLPFISGEELGHTGDTVLLAVLSLDSLFLSEEIRRVDRLIGWRMSWRRRWKRKERKYKSSLLEDLHLLLLLFFSLHLDGCHLSNSFVVFFFFFFKAVDNSRDVSMNRLEAD